MKRHPPPPWEDELSGDQQGAAMGRCRKAQEPQTPLKWGGPGHHPNG